MRHWDDMKELIEEEHTWAEICGDEQTASFYV